MDPRAITHFLQCVAAELLDDLVLLKNFVGLLALVLALLVVADPAALDVAGRRLVVGDLPAFEIAGLLAGRLRAFCVDGTGVVTPSEDRVKALCLVRVGSVAFGRRVRSFVEAAVLGCR